MGQFERKIISFEVTVTEIFKQNKHKLSVVQKTEHLIIFTRKLNMGTCILHLILMFIFGYRQISKRRMFVDLGFLKSKFSYSTTGKYRQDGRLKISHFKHPTFRI